MVAERVRVGRYAALDDAALVEVIAGAGVEGMLAAHEFKRRLVFRKDSTSLRERFEARMGYPFERMLWSIDGSRG
jgi:hypothetical protein